jgi:hypothetical protein
MEFQIIRVLSVIRFQDGRRRSAVVGAEARIWSTTPKCIDKRSKNWLDWKVHITLKTEPYDLCSLRVTFNIIVFVECRSCHPIWFYKSSFSIIMDSINMTNSAGLVSESCHESTFKLIRHHNLKDVLFSVGTTSTFNKYNNIESNTYIIFIKTNWPNFLHTFSFYFKNIQKHHIHVIIQHVKKWGIFSIEKIMGLSYVFRCVKSWVSLFL